MTERKYMHVEAPSVSVAVGIAVLGNGGGIAINEGPVLNFGSTLADLGPVFNSPAPYINEGLASPDLLSNMPITIPNLNLIGSERFAVPDVFQTAFADINLDPTQEFTASVQESDVFQADPITQIVAIYGQPETFGLPDVDQVQTASVIELADQAEIESKIVQGLVTFAEPTLETRGALDAQVALQPATKPAIASQVITQPQTEGKVLLEQQVEQITEVGLDELEKDEPVKEEEEADQVKILHIVDKKGVSRRIEHIVEVIKGVLQIKRTAKDQPAKVSGSEVVSNLLPANKQEIRGAEINDKDPQEQLPDETWEATKESLNNIEIDAEEQIQGQVEKIVLNNHPVAVETKGEMASQENIFRSHKHIGGLAKPYLVFENRRRIKRQGVREEVVEKKNEGTIDSHFELAQALQAA